MLRKLSMTPGMGRKFKTEPLSERPKTAPVSSVVIYNFRMKKPCCHVYGILITAGAMALGSSAATLDKPMDFGPDNPFYAPSTLPFHAPPFDKIKDSDYQPAIEAGMAEQRQEIRAIADNPAPPTFENTLVAMEKTGQLFNRAMAAFSGVTGANLNPELQKVQDFEAPRLAAHQRCDLSSTPNCSSAWPRSTSNAIR